MRREMREEIRGKERSVFSSIKTKCDRQTHTITVLNDGSIWFVDHNFWSVEDLVKEAAIRNTERGCYAVAKTLLSIHQQKTSYLWDYGRRGSRRGKKLSRLHKNGVGDEVEVVLNWIIARKNARSNGRNWVDEYGLPFHKTPGQRTRRLYQRIREEQDAKLQRVMERLKALGFDPLPQYASMQYGVM